MAVLLGFLWRKCGSVRQGYQQAPLVSFAGTGNVEGRTVIDGSADDRQTDGDVHPGLDAKHLYRPVALIMIHRHDDVKVAAACAEKECVCRERSLHVPATSLASAHGRLDFRLFFTVPEKAMLTRMGINAANTNAGVGNSGAGQRFLSAADGALDQARFDLGDGVDQTNVRGDMDDLEFWRR